MEDPKKEKVCPSCGTLKPLTEYGVHKSKKSGRRSWCKACMVTRTRIRREKLKKEFALNPPQYTGAMITCRRCGEEKVDSDYHFDYSKKSGIGTICKPCHTGARATSVKRQPSGIYTIKNKKNGRIYIGQAIHLARRWADHRRGLQKGNHNNKVLQADYDLHGLEGFHYEVIENMGRGQKRSVLLLREMEKILEYHSQGAELYNLLVLD